MDKPAQPSLFAKIKAATSAQLDLMIAKSRASMSELSEDAVYRKSVYKDMNASVGTQGYTEKTTRLSYFFLKQMSMKNSIVAAIIQTYQNHIADFAQPVDDKHARGFRIVLKNEKKHLDAIMKEEFGDEEDSELESGVNTPEENFEELRDIIDGSDQDGESDEADGADQENEDEDKDGKSFGKADFEPGDEDSEADAPEMDQDAGDEEAEDGEFPSDQESEDDQEEVTDRQKLRKAKAILAKRIAGKVQAIQELVERCGYLEDRPFEAKKWTFDSLLRAWTRDTLTYDQYGLEIVPDRKGDLHHWVPVDGSTIRYATAALKNYKNFDDLNGAFDILYPEKELEALEQTDALTLDEEKLKNDEYKFVQVVNGRVVRGFTEKELAVGMRNPTTDIYANGYSIAELELLMSIVSSHIFTENYNKSYFTQGFSAKGLLHIKANMPKRKLESFRAMWNHMIKGNRNSFQTPIIAGVDEVNWIPLTQNHSDIEFNLWMQYLIKVICAIYQIDPFEIGFGMREMGDGGGSLSGDNSEVKVEQSKNKGLRPMLKHFAAFINQNLIDRIDPNFKLEFVGVKDESVKESIARQEKEVKFKKTVNEIREEDGLPPLPGCDDLILDAVYFQWYQNFSPEGKAKQEADKDAQRAQMAQNFGMDPNDFGSAEDVVGPEDDMGGQPDLPSGDVGRPEASPMDKSFKKSEKKASPKTKKLFVDFYRIED